MERLIPVLGQIQETFARLPAGAQLPDIRLPSIVVVGSQSSGKSSVLENIVGRDFLPRGTGTVTRRPLVLNLRHTDLPDSAPESAVAAEYGIFADDSTKAKIPITQVRSAISTRQAALADSGDVSEMPIGVTMYSPLVVDLTLVDLPGMLLTSGAQADGVVAKIDRMVERFARPPESLILLVMPADRDPPTDKGYMTALTLDPTGSRTIVVLTKMDLDAGGRTDAAYQRLRGDGVMSGSFKPRHIIGVKCRSQADVEAGKAIQAALKEEAQWFNSHPTFASCTNVGTEHLTDVLNVCLMDHIRRFLPELKVSLRNERKNQEAALARLAPNAALTTTKSSPGALVLDLITRFSRDFVDTIDGRSTSLSTAELTGGARIAYIFADVYTSGLKKLKPTDGLTLNDIRTALRNATGTRAALFVPEQSFEALVRRQIARLEEPSLQCAQLVFDELYTILAATEDYALGPFPNLRKQVEKTVLDLLQAALIPTKEMISNLVAIELAYINTSHPDFIGGARAIQALNARKAREAEAKVAARNGHLRADPSSPSTSNSGTLNGGGYVALESGSKSPKDEKLSPRPGHSHSKSEGGGGGGLFNNVLSSFRGGGSKQGTSPGGSRTNQNARVRSPDSGLAKSPPAAPISTASTAVVLGSEPVAVTGRPNSSLHLTAPPDTLRASDQEMTETERDTTELIQSLVTSYFNVVRKNVADAVPKAVMHFLVNETKEKVHGELVACLYQESKFAELLKESSTVARQRKRVETQLKALKEALRGLESLDGIEVTRASLAPS